MDSHKQSVKFNLSNRSPNCRILNLGKITYPSTLFALDLQIVAHHASDNHWR